MKTEQFDVVIIGGSLGGVLAAYQVAKAGYRVVLTEETDWIGGQLTNQAVPCDEHPWIEEFGCTRTYRQFRNNVRKYYREHPFIIDDIKHKEIFNPGGGWVSRIAHEPRLSLRLLNEFIEPFIANGKLTVMTNYKPIFAIKNKDTVQTVVVEHVTNKKRMALTGDFFLDATDTGELLPLTGTEYVYGSEGPIYDEPHATDIPRPKDQQPITWVCAVSYYEGEDHTIKKPDMYDFYRQKMMRYGDEHVPLLSFFGPSLEPNENKRKYSFKGPWQVNGETVPPLFSYRQIIDKNLYKQDEYPIHDATLINWPQNDYVFGNIIETPDAEYHKYMARQLTLSLVYWLQTEAPRHDGKGVGYPELRLRGDLIGTDDGLAKAPYIRESRRIKARYTVVEQDIAVGYQSSLPRYWDSVGIGCYHIDLHMTTETGTHFYEKAWPFEIPLGAMIPVRTNNLIPACKNIGTTHITNGCFRLHPVEWNIGEVAGLLAVFCLKHKMSPAKLYEDRQAVAKFQKYLDQEGIERHWPEDRVNAL